MEGNLGIRGWRWLFIIEGALTTGLAIIAYFLLPDWPESTKWLSETERMIAERRLINEQNTLKVGTVQQTPYEGFISAVTNPKCWLLALTFGFTIMGISFQYFFPTAAVALGYDSITTLLLTAPPWIFAMFIAMPNSWHADRTGERFFHYACPAAVCCIGYIISMTTTTTLETVLL